LNNIAQLNKQVTSLLKEYKISSIIKEVFLLAKQTNKFIEDLKPWELFKQNKFKEINNGLFVIANAIRVISIYLSPILTNGVKLINEQMLFSNKHLQIENVDNFDILDNHKILEINKPIYLRK
jgi:methionyl-tRNA synthetase